MLVVLVLSTFWNLVYAVGIGLVISSLIFMKKIRDLTAEKSDIKSLGEDEELWKDEKDFPADLKETVFIKHIKGPLFFGSKSDFQQLASMIPETASAVILRLDRMHYMDQSGLYAMEEMVLDLQKKEVEVVVVGLSKQPRYMMERIGIIPEVVAETSVFKDFDSCLAYIKTK